MLQAQVEKLLNDLIGLEPTSVGESTLHRSIESRMAVCGITKLDEYVDRLRVSTEEMQQLIEHVVVPETWFFRDPETFRVLVEWCSKRVADPRPEKLGDKLRILSVGCCTGEEPYSIAMALLDGGFAADRFTVDAVDVSVRALKHARDGMYGQRSFRTDDLGFRLRYFHSEPGGYRLSAIVRERVRFLEGNVLGMSPAAGEAGYDTVFCRNVLIYFDPQAQERAIENLRQWIVPTGILFAGPAESFLILQKGFATSGEVRGFVRERRQSSTASPVSTPERRRPASPVPQKKLTPKVAKPKLSDARTTLDLSDAARLANSGRLAEAAEICRFYLLETGPSAQAYYLLGLVLDAMDRKPEAADSYRKALYLEPTHLEALSQLALLAENMGDAAVAARLRDRVRRAQTQERK